MLKKRIVYTNPFTDQQVVEEHYFHISKTDLVEMEMEEHANTYEKDGQKLSGMQAKLQRIIDSEDGKAIISELKEMILRAYGKKEGDRFLKSPALKEEFASSEAFSQLLWDLCTDAGAAAEFMNGIVPGNLEQIAADIRERAEVQTQAQNAPKSQPSVAEVADTPAMAKATAVFSEETVDPTGLTNKDTPRVLTQDEVIQMDSDELKSGLATGRYKLG